MEKNKFGNQGFEVSVLGFGAGQIGDINIPDNDVEKLLNFAFDNGITLYDTARGYGASEDRIGSILKDRRKEIILSTKVGYGIDGFEDWTYDIIIAGVEEALKKLQTDYLDIVHLHSCPMHILEKGDVISALLKCKDEGKLRVAAYSGENEELLWAVNSGYFGGIQTSVNICDQKSLNEIIPIAEEKGIGVIAKRAAANAPWRFSEQPYGQYCEQYWSRMKEMQINYGDDPTDLFLRFSAFSPGVSSAITGTTNIEHLKKNIDSINKGHIKGDYYLLIREEFLRRQNNWRGEI